jgi:hypothetical protein
MTTEEQKLKLIQMIIATEDDSTLKKVISFMKDEQMSLAEKYADEMSFNRSN